MNNLVFVDTNVFVYISDPSNQLKSKACSDWIEVLWRENCGRTSIQVLNELYVTLTIKLKPGLSDQKAWKEINDLLAWQPRIMDSNLLKIAKQIQQRWKYSWWDCLIIAAAMDMGCKYLISEDLKDQMRLQGLKIVNPIAHSVTNFFTA